METRQSRLGIRLLASIGFWALAAAAPAWAASYYVDQAHPAASDSNPGTETQPWLTLYRAAKGPLQPGDTVYVKAGRYDVSTGGVWSSPAINPANSGAPGAPITFKSLPTHAAILDTKGVKGNPAIGVRNRDHIVIDGFVIPNPGDKGIVVFGEPGDRVKDIVIQNNIVHGVYVAGFDNTEAIRLEHASNVVVRNNKLYNVRNGDGTSNASAVKTYNTDNVLVENNEIYDVGAAIKEKQSSTYLTVRRNRFYNCDYGLVVNTQNTGVTEHIRYYENVVQCRSGFESVTQSTAPLRNVFIYNNTFAGYSSKAVHGTEHGESIRIWNNIFYRTGSISMADFFTRQPDTNEIKLMDYNLFYQEPKVIIGLYSLNETYNSLSSWQGSKYGLSRNDKLGNPGFVDAAAGNFKLASGSPAIGAGRLDGLASGQVVNIGAYPTGNEIIGLLGTAAPAPGQSPAPPKPPRLLSVD